jgi:transaldolase
MTSNPQKVYELGQSLWYDNIERRLLDNGELKGMIERGDIYGVTSNPSIFHNAIVNSSDYDVELEKLAKGGANANEIFDRLAVQDIQAAADLFLPLYKSTNGRDGYVSIEVHPDLARDTAGTIAEAERLWVLVARPNLMVKIPGTKEGLSAIQASIAKGININITLIFSIERYGEVIEAYLSGLEERVNKGGAINNIASVASFFVSRIDSNIDTQLDALAAADERKAELAMTVKGKIAIANAKLAFELFQSKFFDARFAPLAEVGGSVQRPLWASTSTKNPDYADVLYINELIGKNTVNTVPPKTLNAYKDHGNVAITIDKDMEAARQAMSDLESLGISLDAATDELEAEGVASFSKAIHSLIGTIEERRKEFD